VKKLWNQILPPPVFKEFPLESINPKNKNFFGISYDPREPNIVFVENTENIPMNFNQNTPKTKLNFLSSKEVTDSLLRT